MCSGGGEEEEDGQNREKRDNVGGVSRETIRTKVGDLTQNCKRPSLSLSLYFSSKLFKNWHRLPNLHPKL